MRVAIAAAMALLASTAIAAPAKHRSVAPPHVIPETGVLDNADLVAIIRMGTATNAKADKFTVNPAERYAGREFVAIIADTSTIGTEYNQATQTLQVMDLSGSDYPISETMKDMGWATGQNGYGARARFQTLHAETFGLQVEGERLDYKMYAAHLAPDTARSLSKSLAMRITGVVARGWKSPMYKITGDAPTVITTDMSSSDVTVSDPTQLYHYRKDIHVKATKFELIDTSTGRVLTTR